MDLDKIQALINLVVENGLESLEVTENDCGIKIKRPALTPLAAHEAKLAPAVAEESAPAENELDFNNLKLVTSPMVGVFYEAPAPGEPPFVKVGDKVKKGDVLCIIESMKLMNEIVAEEDGEIVDICVKNGQVVEYAQVLFKIF